MTKGKNKQLELELCSISKSDDELSKKQKERRITNPNNVISIKEIVAKRAKKDDARIYSKILSLADHLY